MLSYIGKISHNSKSNVTAQFKKNVNNYLNGSYLETSGGQSSNLYLNVFSTPVLIRHLRRLKTVFSGEGGGGDSSTCQLVDRVMISVNSSTGLFNSRREVRRQVPPPPAPVFLHWCLIGTLQLLWRAFKIIIGSICVASPEEVEATIALEGIIAANFVKVKASTL
jgi:hypothetical protein